MRSVRVAALALTIAVGAVSSGARAGVAAQGAEPADISPDALAQIDALIAEKESRSATQQKIDSQLLYEDRMETGVPIASGIWTVETDMPYARDGHLVVDVRAEAGSGVAARLAQRGVEIESAA